ncbi:BamA/TamA family outer membrane protein [Novosphingobium lentum]|uniref:BamA/TamA family outer membrane protein n=1 Tax=Novosphingobium lentum TaxID=145287 RepID=UPI001FE19AA7|nr:BamA/TamA family outer membrane protein [Novosphingobium lentum]
MLVLVQAMAGLAGPAAAQSRSTDQELKDLIPDSALDRPQDWAVETQGAQANQGPAPASAVEALDPTAPLPDIAGMKLPWPDQTDLAAIEPLSPDPDIAQAQAQADTEIKALPGPAATSGKPGVKLAGDASLEHVGKQVELAFPPAIEAFPQRDEFTDRFASLSDLKRLAKGDENIAQLSRRARSDRDLLLRMLRVYGYYDADVTQSLGGFSTDGEQPGPVDVTQSLGGFSTDGEQPGPVDVSKVVVHFDIQPGPQYHFGAINLAELETTGPDFTKLRGAFALNVGDAINSDRILIERTNLTTALGENGYAFSTVGDPDLVIDHQPRTGDLTVPVKPGGRYVFGQVVSGAPEFLNSHHLQVIARFRPGDLYKRSQVDDLRKAILATGLVSTVTVTAREATPPAATQPGTVDFDVALGKAPLRTIAGLAGYSSGEGFRAEVSWEHRNFFPPEGLLRFRAVAGTREQLAGVTFRRSNFLTRDQSLTADLFAQTIDTDAYKAKTASFITTFERQTTLIYQKRLVYSAGVELVATREQEKSKTGVLSPAQDYFVIAGPVRAGYDGSDDLLDPTHGFRAALRISPEYSRHNGGGATYVKAQADASYYLPLGGTVVMAARARLGSLAGTTIENVAPSRRFYAGGGGSVRGYGYQNIGPKNTAGDPSGGKSLSEFSLEARVKTGLFGGAVSVVPFVDAGAVDNTSTPRLRDLKIGAGIGLRYKTNFGPLRIDLGTPLNPGPGDSRIGVYVALGQAF